MHVIYGVGGWAFVPHTALYLETLRSKKPKRMRIAAATLPVLSDEAHDPEVDQYADTRFFVRCSYATFANFTFLLSGLASDLLLLRFWLVCSYVFLLVSGILNFPPIGVWTQQSPDLLMLGAIIWPAVVCKAPQRS